MNKNKLIVLTGLDGSGKDFVAEHLQALDKGASLIKTPTPPFEPARLDVDIFAQSVTAAHYFFYLASIIHASTLISNMLEKGNVYCGRYLIDTVAYHRAMGLPVELVYETPLYTIRRPDLTIFLDVSEEQVRQDRMRMRNRKTVGNMIVNQEKIRKAILKEYESLSSHFIKVDNTRRDIKEVVAEIRNLL